MDSSGISTKTSQENNFGFNSSLVSNITKDDSIMGDLDFFQVFFLTVVMFSGFIGNILVVGVVLSRSEMRTRTNYYFTNLSLTCTGSSLTSVVFMIMGLITKNLSLWDDNFCKVNCFLWQLWLSECVFTIIALSVHKYITVIIPLTRVINRKRTFFVIALTWILSVFTATAPLLGWRKTSFKPKSSVCFYDNTSDMLHISHVVFTTSVYYIIPATTVVLIYWRVLRSIRKHKSTIRDTRIIDDMGVRANKRLVLTICIILALFFLCWTPIFIYGILTLIIHYRSDDFSRFLQGAMHCGYSFNVLFPILIAIRNPRFRRGFVDILTCRYLRKDSRTDLGMSFSSTLSNTNSAFEFLEERRCSIWYMSTQKNLLSLEQVPPERRLKLGWIETNL